MFIPACLLAIVLNSLWIGYEMKNAPVIDEEEASYTNEQFTPGNYEQHWLN